MNLKAILLALFCSIFSIISSAQDLYLVTAENGLFVRELPSPDSEKTGKLYLGAEVTILEKTEIKQTILDNGKEMEGAWVQVKFQNFPIFISKVDSGFVFNGFLKKKSEAINEMTQQMSKFPELKGLTINKSKTPFFLQGDFFGDQIKDLVLLVEDSLGHTKVALINYGKTSKTHLLGDENDPFEIQDYNWIGIFQKVNQGQALWSNYEDDFIDFEDVPENEKVRLNYDAMYMHLSESCGGGYVYWKDGKFNWLQQE